MCLEGGALQSWKLVGGGGQSHCQELGSNSSNTSGLMLVGGGDSSLDEMLTELVSESGPQHLSSPHGAYRYDEDY